MELIPILSLIILVATISTFMLSVGAYILYKIRERKGVTSAAPQPSAIPAELVAPAPLVSEQRIVTPGEPRKTFDIPQQEYGFEPQRQQSYVPQDDYSRGPELRPTFVGNAPSTYSETHYQRPTGEQQRQYEQERKSAKGKFMRYTNEGYVEPTKQERKQEDNLRWR
ncbi:MAG: hypothetical protein HYZ10_02285 [Ignavibacteriales bacterium]|nr:MAG: hypothetical protein FD122_1763 [Stygiobacter sp.]KAF0217311.1 MAG: hypothetical protein FD178_644 [Ignavibacteria bacterium]MBI3123211.1 hypothetical protein [Ignavibacteriales bacterium]OGU67325.1 MAG: hypothetical protein A2X62_09165 [Stygiobacter sp. GWC2_38_9]OGU81171.1 MAG: hypothetical protein A2279_02690 [Stygiobacter sp. RIFOXYA12_FULL_38_9]OGV08039.1 MAG: hypothetical protein A2299_16010 [Stygiobacter sp. RIFOXYB2_FULL_37_11]OGV13071.1 MAG: hypothetical protein A2237_05695 [